MTQPTYIYIVTDPDAGGHAGPLLARTQKYELVNALARMDPAFITNLEVWRAVNFTADHMPASKYLGTAPQFLAKEIPGYAEQVKAAMERLDGTTASAVALLTGQTPEQLDALGGFNAA